MFYLVFTINGIQHLVCHILPNIIRFLLVFSIFPILLILTVKFFRLCHFNKTILN